MYRYEIVFAYISFTIVKRTFIVVGSIHAGQRISLTSRFQHFLNRLGAFSDAFRMKNVFGTKMKRNLE